MSSNFKNKAEQFWKGLKSYFNVASDLVPQIDAETNIRSGVSFKGSQLLVLIFAIFIASLGLNTDSIPVVIGAMLISPLMGPIMGMGLAIGIQDFTLLRTGLKNIVMAVVGSVLASALYFLISPQYEGMSQLLARTSPSIYDVFIALFGGAAGIISVACRNKAEVMPGVAIATSLMPPLCTAGYGLATFQATFFFGALYLFFTNMVFILFATWIGVKLFGFTKVIYQNEQRTKRVKTIVYTVITLTVAFSAYLTMQMIRKNVFIAEASKFVELEMVFPNTQVLNHDEYMKGNKRYIDVTLIGEALPKDSLQLAMMNKLDSVGLGGTVLNIKQGFSITNTEIDNEQNFNKFYGLMQTQITQKQNAIDSLKTIIKSGEEFSKEAVKIAPEIKVVFPEIKDIALSQMIAANTDNSFTDTVNILFVSTSKQLSQATQAKLKEYVEVRLKRKAVHLILNPTDFPWPVQQEKAETAKKQ